MGVHWSIPLCALVAVATADTCPDQQGPEGVQVRIPPTFNTSATYWDPPATGWLFRGWHQIWTSNTQVAAFRNFQWDPTSVDASSPAGPINDLSSFQIPGNDTIYTSYGIATPNPNYVLVQDYRGTGILENATSQYSWLAWGCDGNGLPYYMSYSTAAEASGTPDGVDIMSVTDLGLDQPTVDALIEGLKSTGNELMEQIAETMVKNRQDGARRGLPRKDTCGEECKTNENLIPILG